MTEISKKFEQLIIDASKSLVSLNQIMPVKTDKGIEVGNVLITSTKNLKHLHKHGKIVYNNISLNSVAIKLANLLATSKHANVSWNLYLADQEYGKWFSDYQHLKAQYHKALLSKDFERADILFAKYNDSKCKVEISLKHVNTLLAKMH